MLRKIPTFWLMLFGLMLTSAITLGLMSVNAIQTTGRTVENEQITQLRSRAGAHALSINERLRAFENATELLARQAKLLMLSNDLSSEEIQSSLKKYQRDSNNVLGLDLWYEDDYKPRFGDNNLSNVFLNKNTQLTPQLEYLIASTEKLDPLFASIYESGVGSQWLYLTLPSGMMRLYPYTASSEYPIDWLPQEHTFYTVADRARNPNQTSAWTAPYNDYAGAGLMVTNSYPVYDGEELIGVMSNDILIKDLQDEILGFKVGINGFAFLLDSKGNVIAHKRYAPEDTPLGTEINIKLAEQEPYLEALMADMLQKREGAKIVVDEAGEEWVVVYAPIEATNWHLALIQPRSEIIQPATDIANQLKYISVVLIFLAFLVSIVIARWISFPVMQLSKKARQISLSVDAMDASIQGHSVILAENTDTSDIKGTREIYGLALVFGEMVSTLRKRINELGSIYILGQTIAAAIDYEKTIETVLQAVDRTIVSENLNIYIVENGNWNMAGSINSEIESSPSQRIPLPESLLKNILSQKSSFLVKDVNQSDDNPEAISFMRGNKIYSLLAAPLNKDDKPVGLISLENYRKNQFTEDDQRQLNRIAALASIAISNAIQVRQREQALKEQIRELKIEIDETKRQREVDEIVDTEYFKELRQRVAKIRSQEDETPSPDKKE